MADEQQDEELSLVSFSDDIESAEKPDLLPPGGYPAEITKAEVAKSQAGNLYCKVQMKIKVEDFPADYDRDNAPNGKMLTYSRLSLADTIPGRYNLKQFCEKIGAQMPKKGESLDVSSWQGLQCKAVITHDTYEGNKREAIARVEKL